MAPPTANPHDFIKYHKIRKSTKYSEPGCYQLHDPFYCRHKFPITKRPIHKCELPEREQVSHMVPGIGTFRRLIVPRPGKNLYPAVMHKNEYERLKKQAKIVTHEEQIQAMLDQEQAVHQAVKASEKRKQHLKNCLLPQPGAESATGATDPDMGAPDQAAYTLSRAEMIKADNMQGPRLCNRIILASKCHAIRDAQILEKQLIKKELVEEEKRLDAIMEENRQAAEARAQAEEARRHALRLHNRAALQEQIRARATAKIMEAERIEEESIRVNQASIAMQMDEAEKLKQKHDRQLNLKETLDQGNAELLYFKQLQNEEERISDLRVANFLRAKREREARLKAQADQVKAAKQKGIDHIAKAQKAEQELKEELARIRNLKIQEDVERDYRRKERDNAIRRNKEMRQLHESRVNQINDIHKMIAREIAKDEQNFNNAARQNEEFLQKEKKLEDQHRARVEAHRQAIMKQINDKERNRAEMREKIHNEGVALRMEQEQKDKYEKKVIQEKVRAMRQQKIAEKYVSEVQQSLSHYGY